MVNHTNYKKLFRILDDVNINELRWFLYNRKGYFKKFITWLNDYNYMSGYDIRKMEYFMLNMCRKSQIPYNLIWVIELFKPKKQLAEFHFYHKFDQYIGACIDAGQYNNAKVIIKNYPISLLSIFELYIEKKFDNNLMVKLKKIYHICCTTGKNKIISLRNLINFSNKFILWYHSMRKFSLREVRQVLSTIGASGTYVSVVKRIETQCKIQMKMQLLSMGNFTKADMFDAQVLNQICEF